MICVTLDSDWACEPALEETLDFLQNEGITPTVFSTHPSKTIEKRLDQIEVGLHPYFAPDSSHGATIAETVAYITALPHNLPAFRCHRFSICNASKQAMVEAGMRISSNVCADLEIVAPFRDRFGIIEVPIFLEDGGYLWRNHPLELHKKLVQEGTKVLLIHPMHFVLNTPHFSFMRKIKDSMSREKWNNMSRETLNSLRWKERGIRDLLVEMLRSETSTTLSELVAHSPQPQLL